MSGSAAVVKAIVLPMAAPQRQFLLVHVVYRKGLGSSHDDRIRIPLPLTRRVRVVPLAATEVAP